MEQSKRYSKKQWITAGVIVALLLIPCIVIAIQMASSEPNPCESATGQMWLYDVDLKGTVTLYEKAAGVSIADVIPVYGIGQSLLVDVDQKCTYGEHVYYHVDLGDTAGWVSTDYLRWSKPRPEGTIKIP